MVAATQNGALVASQKRTEMLFRHARLILSSQEKKKFK
jgi:hypothetical protein